MAKAQYTEEQFKDFGDFYAYTDVFDWHYVNILEWKDGIECKVDDNGNGIPDDEENGADYFEVSKPKTTKK